MLYLFSLIIWGIIWGCATNAVIHNKGYEENWFFWGFLFGFIPLIVACAKPENKKEPPVYNPVYAKAALETEQKKILANGGWTCICGEVNTQIISTCKCGRTKSSSEAEKQKECMEKISKEIDKRIALQAQQKMNGAPEIKEAAEEKSSKAKVKTEDELIRALKDYKDLLESGIISQEEFDSKKKQLLE